MAGNWPGKGDNYPRLGVRVTELFGSCRTATPPILPAWFCLLHNPSLLRGHFMDSLSGRRQKGSLRGQGVREETVGGLLITQTKNHQHKQTIEFDLVGELSAIKYIQISWRVEKFHRLLSQPIFSVPFQTEWREPFAFSHRNFRVAHVNGKYPRFSPLPPLRLSRRFFFSLRLWWTYHER